MIMKQSERWKKLVTIIFLIICLLVCVLLFKAYMDGRFDSVETLQEYIEKFGVMAPLALTVIQAAQVVFPVLPGFLGCMIGTIMFGCAGGFWCNYIGISLGSIIAFLLARKYGQALVNKIFPEKKYQKWAIWAAESKFYTIILFFGMVLPLFPDDYFCYFTGITKMSIRKFVAIIILGKPWCILAYSIIFSATVS